MSSSYCSKYTESVQPSQNRLSQVHLNARSPAPLPKAVTDFCFCLCWETVEDIAYLSQRYSVLFKEKRWFPLRIRTYPPSRWKTKQFTYLAACCLQSNLYLMPGLYHSLNFSSPKSQQVWILIFEVPAHSPSWCVLPWLSYLLWYRGEKTSPLSSKVLWLRPASWTDRREI